MATVLRPRFLLFGTSLFVFLVSLSFADQKSFRPRALVLPVTKDAATGQYVTTLKQRTPLVPVRLTVDVGGRSMWVDCESASYVSSAYRTPRCRSSQCSLAKAEACGDCFSGPRPGCNNNTCSLFLENTIIQISTIGELTEDVLSVSSTDGSNLGRVVSVSRFLFLCSSPFLLRGFPSGVTGMAGLGRTNIALPSQFASAFSFRRKFAVCLPSGGSSRGVVFFGDGPYRFLPAGIDASSSLTYTPLIVNPVSNAGAFVAGEVSAEYFIGVKSIKIDGKAVPLNSTLFKINRQSGVGGTKISTVNAYTALETSIYNAVVSAFVRAAKSMNIARVTAVAPFGACFSSKNIGSTRVGPAAPPIDLVLQNPKVYWRIFGANSMVYVRNDVFCLGFVDGGSEARTSIIIGGHQLEDNLLQFDLASSRLGFTSSLRFRQTTCANFNFTSTA